MRPERAASSPLSVLLDPEALGLTWLRKVGAHGSQELQHLKNGQAGADFAFVEAEGFENLGQNAARGGGDVASPGA